MAWKVWGSRYNTSDMSDATIYTPYVPDRNIVVIACRIWMIVYNNPPFTSLHMKVYSDNGGFPKKLLHTSTNTQLKAAIHTEDNAAREMWFDWDEIPLRSGDKYHFVVNGTGYTGSESSHLAWMRGYPDPVHEPPGFGFNDVLAAPRTLYCVGADL